MKNIIVYVILILSLAVNIGSGFLYIREVRVVNQQRQKIQSHLKILHFRNLFTEKVLLADREVDFNARLDLENAVRDLNDPEILNQWEIFTKSASKEEATDQAKKILRLLIKKSLFDFS